MSPEVPDLRADYVSQRTAHRKLVRSVKAEQAILRDSQAYQVLTKDPRPFFKRIKIAKKGKTTKINKIIVGAKSIMEMTFLMVSTTRYRI